MTVFALPGGEPVPRLGQGTWRMGESPAAAAAEVDALRAGLDAGLTLIDTAEMYADAELVVADAVRGRRAEVYLVSKVLPSNASRAGTIRACEQSLARLGTDYLDLYLLHWPGAHPLGDTLAAFGQLHDAGKIRHYGVSNFDVADLEAARGVPDVGPGVCADQILYSLATRRPERRLLPWCREHSVEVMAYSPLEQDALPLGGALGEVASTLGATPRQVALAWTLREPGVVTIVKSSRVAHVRENAAALDVALPPESLAALDAAFPAPAADGPLEWR